MRFDGHKLGIEGVIRDHENGLVGASVFHWPGKNESNGTVCIEIALDCSIYSFTTRYLPQGRNVSVAVDGSRPMQFINGFGTKRDRLAEFLSPPNTFKFQGDKAKRENDPVFKVSSDDESEVSTWGYEIPIEIEAPDKPFDPPGGCRTLIWRQEAGYGQYFFVALYFMTDSFKQFLQAAIDEYLREFPLPEVVD